MPKPWTPPPLPWPWPRASLPHTPWPFAVALGRGPVAVATWMCPRWPWSAYLLLARHIQHLRLYSSRHPSHLSLTSGNFRCFEIPYPPRCGGVFCSRGCTNQGQRWPRRPHHLPPYCSRHRYNQPHRTNRFHRSRRHASATTYLLANLPPAPNLLPH